MIPPLVNTVTSNVKSGKPLDIRASHAANLSSAINTDLGIDAGDTSQKYVEFWEKIQSQLLSGDIDGAYATFSELERDTIGFAAVLANQAAKYDLTNPF